MVCIGIYITLFANLLLRLDESNMLSIVTSTSILSTIVCLSNWNTNPVSNSLDKRSSCLKYSFTSLLFWLAVQKHILDITVLLNYYLEKNTLTKNSSLNQSHESTQVYHICVEKHCTCPLYFYLPPHEYNPYSDPSLLYMFILHLI